MNSWFLEVSQLVWITTDAYVFRCYYCLLIGHHLHRLKHTIPDKSGQVSHSLSIFFDIYQIILVWFII
ncbi:hypothetical protein EJ350_19600 [Vibrio parahaemolyticus]|nr:hypothetical protein [Vibrio parahaemolyticus]EGR1593833.1 hypothetical protein [Vibrio parahaemolyticus]